MGYQKHWNHSKKSTDARNNSFLVVVWVRVSGHATPASEFVRTFEHYMWAGDAIP
jgi:hypothetical protein